MATAVRPVRTRLLFPTVALGLLLTATACGSGDAPAASGSSGGGGGEGLKIGVTVSNSTNPFFVLESNTVIAAGKALGAEVLSQEAQEDVTVQSNQIDQFITSGVDFIVIDPVDSDAVGPAVKRAIDAGIPVVGIDSVTKNASASVTTNNVQAGEVSCESLAKQINGKGDIAILDGTPISAVSDRVTGCKKTLENYPDITIVAEQRGDNSRDKALPVATDILTANPNIVAMFAINDPTAAGVELAAKQKNMQIIITSVDGAKAAVDTITSGGMITATAAQDPVALANKGVEIGNALHKGEKPAETLIELPTTLVDKATAADYTPWG
ncbi:substrate-binding domain-containing protein [Nakamurella deserti]|uniref:substrate-binding domain-containing protein n=1 Tax=Nakamurella deserti TaxID=2164074 RepID=UPI000DBE3004|nr:substrate-binding domain-containing protein [Nakamurella deserti]